MYTCWSFISMGAIFGDHHVFVVLADMKDRKHLLDVVEWARESQVLAQGSLEDLVRRGTTQGING